MDSDADRDGAGKERTKMAQGHPADFAANFVPLHPAAKLIRQLAPKSRADRVALFEHRTTWNTIRAWMRGRRRMPQWAIDIIGVRSEQLSAMHAAISAKPASKRGQALAAWRASRNSER